MNYTKRMDLKCFMKKVSRFVIVLLFMLSFPMISEAVVHTYYTNQNGGTSVATGITTNWNTCANGTSVITLANQDSSGTCDARMEVSGGGIYYEVWYNTAFGVATTIQGQATGNVWNLFERQTGGNCTLSLLYVIPDGTITVLGSDTVNVPNTNSAADFDFDLSAVSGDAPAGSKLGFRLECDATFRVYVGPSNNAAGTGDSGYVTVDETIACTQTGSLSVLSGRSLGGNPIDLTSITNNVNASNVIYSVPEESYSDTEANASSVDTTGWTDGTKTLNLTGNDAICGTPLPSASDTFTYSTCPAQSPNDLSAQKGTTQVLLQWTGASCGVNNDTYTVYRDASPVSGCQNIACAAGTMSCTDTGVTGGSTYTYTVRAFNSGSSCEGPDSNPQVVTIPTGFTVNSCSRCHAMPPVDGTARNTPAGAVVGDHGISSHVPGSARTDCQTCHTIPASDTNFDHRNGDINMQATISGGSYSRGTSFAQGNPLVPVTGTCSDVSCHGGTGSTTPQWGVGTEDCTTCHDTSFTKNLGSGGTIRNVTGTGGDFDNTSRHVFGGTPIKWDCIVCHREGVEQGASVGRTNSTYHNDPDPGGGMIDLRNVDSPTTGWSINNKSMTDAMYTDMDTFCLRCHDSNGANGINVNAADDGLNLDSTRALTPFNSSDAVSAGGNDAGTSTPDAINTYTNQTNCENAGFTWVSGACILPRTRVIDVDTQFNTGNPSHHAVKGQRYTTTSTTDGTDNWGDSAWVDRTLKSGTRIITDSAYETATLHCADCHSVDTNAHGSANGYMLQAASIDETCWLCHDSTTYSNSGSASNGGSRQDHSDDGGHTMSLADGSLLGRYGDTTGYRQGSNCLLCHGGADYDGYGAIHGIPSGTDARTGNQRYRFTGGSTMSAQSDFTTTNQISCYFESDDPQPWSQCQHHSNASVNTTTPPYGRGTSY